MNGALTKSAIFGCGLRPFFLGCAIHAACFVPLWVLALSGWLPLPAPAGGPLVWHGYEMVFGFALAALCGFLLTAVPSFTDTPHWHGRPLAILFALWLGGRLLGFLPGNAAATGTLCDLALLGGLLRMTLPPLLRAGPQRGFAFALLGFTAVAMLTAWQRFIGGNPLPALHMAMGMLNIFVVLAVRRIGVRLFQRALPAGSDRVFLPRPPASRIAIFSLLLATLAPWVGAPPAVTGWLSLAAGAAVFHLTGDWHLGRTLFYPRIFIFYLGLWGIALGHLGIGAGFLLGEPMWTGAFRHISVMVGIGLPILGVLCVAGRAHTGHEPERHSWFPAAIALLVLAAAVRVGYALTFDRLWLIAAAACWLTCFATYAVLYRKTLTRPGPNGEIGC